MAQNTVDFELALRGFAGGTTAEVILDYGADSTAHAGPFAVTIEHDRLAEAQALPDRYGAALTDMLFAQAGLREALAEARGIASGRQLSLRLRLRLGAGAEALHALRWELLHLPGRNERLCTREDILFSRYLPVGSAALPPAPKSTLRALAAVAGPTNAASLGLAPLDLAHEITRAQAGLPGLAVDWLHAGGGQFCTLDQLAQRIPGHEVLYLVCHGKMIQGEGWLVLEDDEGLAARVSANDLARRLAGTLALPRLAVLVMCESAGSGSPAEANAFTGSLAPRLVEIGIPAVVAMQSALTFTTANLFLPVLFRELMNDGQIDRAVAAGRRAIIGRPDEHAPVLLMGLKSGQLWAAAQAVQPIQAAPVPAFQPQTAPARPPDPIQLYQALNSDAFTMEDLESLCYNLGVDWEQLRGGVKAAKARAMVQFFQSRGRLAELAAAARAERPNLEL